LQVEKSKTDFAIGTIIAEIDNKQTCRLLQTTIQMALLKISNALAFAITGNTSPYVLSQTELNEIANSARNSKIFLTNDINHVKTNVLRDDTKLLFTFAIPILEDSNIFRIYSVRPFPIFSQAGTGGVYTTISDLDYIGISSSSLDYIPLTTNEYQNCLKSKFCTVAATRNPIDDKAHCTVATFTYNNQSCLIKEINPNTRPFFATYGNTTFYSTPPKYQGRAICPTTSSQEPLNENLVIQGTGLIQIKPGCYLSLPDNRKIASHAKPTAIMLGETTITQAFHYVPTHNAFQFVAPPEYNRTKIPDLILKPVPINKIKTLLSNAWTPENISSTSQIFFAIVAIIASILGIICCISPKFRHFWRAGCPSENPRKYYTKYKNYHLPTFVKMPKREMPSWTQKFTKEGITKHIQKKYNKLKGKEARQRQYDREMLALHDSQQKLVEQMLDIKPLRTDILNQTLVTKASVHARPTSAALSDILPSAPEPMPILKRSLYPSIISKDKSKITGIDNPAFMETPRAPNWSPVARVRFADNNIDEITIADNSISDENLH